MQQTATQAAMRPAMLPTTRAKSNVVDARAKIATATECKIVMLGNISYAARRYFGRVEAAGCCGCTLHLKISYLWQDFLWGIAQPIKQIPKTPKTP
jgi:hypothetical protein